MHGPAIQAQGRIDQSTVIDNTDEEIYVFPDVPQGEADTEP